MVDKVKNTASTIVDNQYNKATYSALGGAIVTLIFYVLRTQGIEATIELQGAVTTIVMFGITYFAKNKQPGGV